MTMLRNTEICPVINRSVTILMTDRRSTSVVRAFCSEPLDRYCGLRQELKVSEERGLARDC
jgi:hypothetical protein